MASSQTSVVRAGHSNWLIGLIAAIAIVGLAIALFAEISGQVRSAQQQQCIASIVSKLTQRSAVLTPISKARTDADSNRQHWTTVEQRLIRQILLAQKKHQHVNVRQALHRYTYASGRYLAADARWKRLNTQYNQAAAAHPVPKLKCAGATPVDQPVPTVTATHTLPRPAPVTSTATATKTPSPIRIHVPGPTRVIREHPPTVVRTSTVTVAPGHHHGKGHR